jgi:hypothetical protein
MFLTMLLLAACLTGLLDFRLASASTLNASTKFGIIYSTWHCLAVSRSRAQPPDVSKILAGQQRWASIPSFHFWAEPQAGYYCLTERPDVIRSHAIALRDAGIDFIVIDATNNEFTDGRTPDSRPAILEPLRRILSIWNDIPNAPKIVPWAPLTERGDMLEHLLRLLDDYPNLRFVYHDRPLAIITQNPLYMTDEAKALRLSERYTIRRMWGHQKYSGPVWSFLEICQPGFHQAQATVPCNQRRAALDGKVEEIPISASYQETYITDKRTAVPRFGGRTFVKQFETLGHLEQ